MKKPDETPDPLFPGMPHEIHRALHRVLAYAGSQAAAGVLLAEYELKTSQKLPPKP